MESARRRALRIMASEATIIGEIGGEAKRSAEREHTKKTRGSRLGPFEAEAVIPRVKMLNRVVGVKQPRRSV